MKIFAHRGCSKQYPENTCIAFQKAAALPVFGVEFDVHLTADKQLVVIHDETIDRTSTGTGFVKDMTLAQLKQYDYGKWFGEQFAGEKIPTLTEVLTLFQDTHHVLNIEIKSDIFEYEGIEQLIADEIDAFGMHDRVIVSSFNHESIQRFHRLQPTIQTGALFASLVTNIEGYVKALRSDALHIYYFHAYRHIIQAALANGTTVRTFTVNDIDIAKELQSIGVEAIFTDDPEMMIAEL
ncbi:glycerophosphodiester phosphodiesterase [Lysinibacillus sp. LZ02]|uniref:glycerophosphodiester phosphodiesterase n=1 Tax=Lysinibacillus sp. LZ02 TaxID=3420668 RepID=UPI003D35A21F